jgi:hypothetical protein
LNRSEKIHLLQRIRDNKISKRVLLPPKTYVFFEHKGDVICYEMDGRVFSLNEYEGFCKQVEADNVIQRQLDSNNIGSLVITIQYVENKKIL